MGGNFNNLGGNDVGEDYESSENGWDELSELADKNNIIGDAKSVDGAVSNDNLEALERDKTRTSFFWRIGNLAHNLFKRKRNISGDSEESISDSASEIIQVEHVTSEMPEDATLLDESEYIEEPDKPLFDAEMQEVLREARDAKRERMRSQRKQELLERDLNAHLTTVEGLEEDVEAGTPGVSKRFVEHNGVSIPVYDLNGLPFEMLSSGISGLPAEDPSMWLRKLEEVKKNVHHGRKFEGSNETICTSYINSETNITTRLRHYKVSYGFSHVDAGSVIDLGASDIGSPTFYGKGTIGIGITDENALRHLQNNVFGGYNEVVLSRFSETGVPRRPDYIITENGSITDVVMTHAAFFGIPIVNFALRPYLDKVAERAMPVLDRVTNDSSWEEIDSVLREVQEIPDIATSYTRGRAIMLGDGSLGRVLKSEPEYKKGFNGCIEKLERIRAFEAIKRYEFVVDILRENINACREATAKGERFASVSDVGMEGVLKGFEWYDGGDASIRDDGRSVVMVKGGRPRIMFDFVSRDGKELPLTVYDEESNGHTDEIGEHSDQYVSCYDKLVPILKEFFDAIRENKEACAQQ